MDPTIKTLAGFGVNAIEDNFGEHAVKSKFRAAIKPKTIIYHTNLRSFLFIIAPLFYVVVYAIKTLQSYPVVTVVIFLTAWTEPKFFDKLLTSTIILSLFY